MKKLLLILLPLIMMASCAKYATIEDLPSHYATLVDGTKVHYKVCGSGNITLLFVHGFGCDMNAWEMQYEDFKNDTIRMIFVDLPGYGKSDKPETDYTLSYFSNALKCVMDSVHVKSAVLVGHSLGTPICRQFVFDYPAQSVALCDIDGVYCFYPDNAASLAKYQKEIDTFVGSFQGEQCKENIEQFVASLEGPFTPEWIGDYAMSTMPNTPEYVASNTMKNLVDPEYWTGEMINIPTLVICTRTSGISPDNKLLMDKLYNDFTYVELDNTGHFIMMEDYGIVDNLLERSYERWKHTEL